MFIHKILKIASLKCTSDICMCEFGGVGGFVKASDICVRSMGMKYTSDNVSSYFSIKISGLCFAGRVQFPRPTIVV